VRLIPGPRGFHVPVNIAVIKPAAFAKKDHSELVLQPDLIRGVRLVHPGR